MPFINTIFNNEKNALEESSQITQKKPKLQETSNEDTKNASILVSTAQTLQSSTADGLSAIEELKSTMESIAAAAEESSGAAEESLSATNQIKENTSTILEMSTKSAHVIQKLEDSITIASSKITDSSENMLRIAKSAEHVGDVGDRLSVAGKEISKTVNLITKLAKRTSLLALNAAIEATRAEEKGKSFSVMAKEIRALSAKSNSYAQEIKTVVQDIQNSVENVQSTIVDTKSSVEKASEDATDNAKIMKDLIKSLISIVDDVNKSLEEFKTLDDEVIKMQLSSETIASAAQESAGAVSEVSQTISMQATAFRESNIAATMLESLSKKVDKNKSDESIVNELASSAEELSSAIEEIESSMAQGMVALSQIKEAAEISKDDANKNTNIAIESNKTTKLVKSTIVNVNSEILKIQDTFKINVSNISKAGLNSKKDLINTEDILKESKHVKRNIKYLKKILRKIELTIVQTAALSINGSVEAMRVGELGEGFSIVSNDIRNLAENSEQSLDQINDIVDNLEDETESIIEAIDKMQMLGVKEAESLIILAQEMQQNTQEIDNSVNTFKDIDEKLLEIENALTQSQIASEQILTASELALNNANESKIAAEHIQNISSNMSDNVSDLIEVAAQYKDE